MSDKIDEYNKILPPAQVFELIQIFSRKLEFFLQDSMEYKCERAV